MAVQKVASTWGGSVANTWIAGTPSSNLTYAGAANLGAVLYIGNEGAANTEFNGNIRFVRIYSQVLTSGQIGAIAANDEFGILNVAQWMGSPQWREAANYAVFRLAANR